MKIYISGPITGLDYAKRKNTFAKAAREIADKGHEPINPMELDHSGHDKSWEDYMKVCIKALCDCDRIYIMPRGVTHEQFIKSRGVRMEEEVARELKIKKLYLISDLIKV